MRKKNKKPAEASAGFRKIRRLNSDFEGEPRSAANPHVANPPAIAIPEALPLPVTAIRISRDIGRSTVVAIAGAVIARSISVRIRTIGSIGTCGDGAADDGAADDPAGYSRTKTALGMGR